MENQKLNQIYNSSNLITHNKVYYTNFSFLERKKTFTKEKNNYLKYIGRMEK